MSTPIEQRTTDRPTEQNQQKQPTITRTDDRRDSHSVQIRITDKDDKRI